MGDDATLRSQPHRIATLAYPGMAPFELSIVIEVFGLPRPELDVASWYSLDVCAVEPGECSVVGGLTLTIRHGLSRLRNADTIVIPGWPIDRVVPASLVAALRRAHRRGARLVSICSGAFVLAAAGLLDGRVAATHWQYAEALAERHPAVEVNRDVLYVDDGDVLTSAGSAAGLDLCLHLIRRDHGAAVANQVARRLVVPAHREGGQAQYVERPVAVSGDDNVHQVIAWINAAVAAPTSVADLAARAALSERHFTRRFREITGQTPIAYLTDRRIDASLALLESGDQSIDQVATAVGFANPVTYRHHFRARMHTSPSAYRRAFRA
jgi:AraC family transcriptional activator FtrA